MSLMRFSIRHGRTQEEARSQLQKAVDRVANVFVLPVVIAGITYLVNRNDYMGPQRAGPLLNLGLAAALVFSCLISYTGMVALKEFF